ncbi:TPA: hypothetical protein WI070_000151 [Neisseria meningitidis]|uniref:hypothetical protein n=1 Tax=Neisseria lactamica TaxID=486 RepID=UPI000E594C04|nr:hypothetical protein [Neisseria lactamica]
MPSEQNLSISDGIGISKKASRQLRRRMKYACPCERGNAPSCKIIRPHKIGLPQAVLYCGVFYGLFGLWIYYRSSTNTV